MGVLALVGIGVDADGDDDDQDGRKRKCLALVTVFEGRKRPELPKKQKKNFIAQMSSEVNIE